MGECDRAKYNERVGENGNEFRVTSGFLCAKTCECVLLSEAKRTAWDNNAQTVRFSLDRAFSCC